MIASVIIPAYNAASTIARQLDALSVQSLDGRWEIVVADNLSTDATAAIVASYRSPGDVPVRLVRADRRQGPNVARNVGAAAAEAPLLLFLDADDEVQPGWLPSMVAALEEYDCVGGSLVPVDGDVEGDRLGLHHGLDFLPSPVGANCGCRREVWQELRFDEDFGGGGDETEFFWRAQLHGHTLGYVPEATVRYHARPTFEAKLRQRESLGAGHVRLFKKFAPAGMPRSPTARAVKDWAWLALFAWSLPTGNDRAVEWRWRFARRRGRLRASIRLRTLYL